MQPVPLVSVVIAAKDEAEFAQKAIESILNQSDCELELIFVDDNSTDATVSIVESIACSHSNLRLLRNDKAGKCSAFNLGVSAAKGDYVCIFAGDDIMPPKSLSSRLESIQGLGIESPAVGLSKLRIMSDDKKVDGMVIPRRKGVSSLSGASPFMNRKAAQLIFPVPESLPNEDTWMELCITYFEQIQTVHTDIIGCNWRHHAGNSINHMLPFNDFCKKLTVRLEAYSLFEKTNSRILSEANGRRVRALVECEKARRAHSVIGIMLSGAPLTHKLRMMSAGNRLLYGVRASMYGLLSGW